MKWGLYEKNITNGSSLIFLFTVTDINIYIQRKRELLEMKKNTTSRFLILLNIFQRNLFL